MDIYFSKQLSIFDNSMLISLVFRNALLGTVEVQDEKDYPEAAQRLLCHAAKKMMVKLLKKSLRRDLAFHGEVLAMKETLEKDEFDENGKKFTDSFKKFLKENLEIIEELVPNRNNRNYRSSRFQVDYLKAVAFYEESGEIAETA